MAEDPFLEVKADTLHQLNQARTLFSSYLRIRATAPASEELVTGKDELDAVLREIENEYLEDLGESVRVVEVDPSRYGLDKAEVTRRKRFVSEVKGELDDMREEMRKPIPSRTSYSSRRSPPEDPDLERGDAVADFEQQHQQILMADQDQNLTSLHRSLYTLNSQAHTMSNELADQSSLLREVEDLADKTQDKLKVGMKRVGEVLRSNEDWLGGWCVGLLGVVLVVVLALLILL
ncbi:hypothetical protein YB2330_002953 [Saitoella coloradoensis]